ncbi:hypothetical protein HWV62_14674 [Athelia sp. TMB]|nr:hypothetical protein HWV62_14674 [Athelia sp. TMB]
MDSLNNLKDVTIGLDARILSSTLEIAQCTRLKVTFKSPSSVPAIVQLDPTLDDVEFEFLSGARPGAFVVSPRLSQDAPGIGLTGIRVVLNGSAFELVDSDGCIHRELLISLEGRTGDQYTIKMREEPGTEAGVWSMKPVDKIAALVLSDIGYDFESPDIDITVPPTPAKHPNDVSTTTQDNMESRGSRWLVEAAADSHYGSCISGKSMSRNAPSAAVSGTASFPPSYPKHNRFFLPAENIYFLVQGILYSVHRVPFEQHSTMFKGKGVSEAAPLFLNDISHTEFDQFLSILYPTDYGVFSATTVKDWSSILRLSDLWAFLSIRSLAIKHLTSITSPIDKIVIGRRYAVNEWLIAAYGHVCRRPEPLNEEEGMKLGMRDVIRITSVRQEFSYGAPLSGDTSLSDEVICARFELPITTSAGRTSLLDVSVEGAQITQQQTCQREVTNAPPRNGSNDIDSGPAEIQKDLGKMHGVLEQQRGMKLPAFTFGEVLAKRYQTEINDNEALLCTCQVCFRCLKQSILDMRSPAGPQKTSDRLA